MIFRHIKRFALFTLVIFCVGCYSFRGINIPPGINTFYIPQVGLDDFQAPPDLPEKFMEALRAKVRNQSPLLWEDENPDVQFDCSVKSFRVNNRGATAANQVAFNELVISVKVDYVNNVDESDTWSKNFSFNVPFDPATDLQTVQNDFIDEIFEQISEQVFNEAFTNW